MGRAKEIIVKVIPAKIANEFVKKHHYSGKVDPRCYVHFGCFLDDKLHGVMQLGPSITSTLLSIWLKTLIGTGTVNWQELHLMIIFQQIAKAGVYQL